MIVRRFRVLHRVAVLALGLTATNVLRPVATSAQSPAAQHPVVTVQSEVYQPLLKGALDKRGAQSLKRASTRDSILNTVTLAPVTETPPPPASNSLERRLQVGFSRDIPAGGAASLRRAGLIWDAVDGGSVTAVSVASPGAVALRLAVAFGQLPAGTEVRFFGPSADSQVFGPVTADQIRALTVPGEAGAPDLFWSPAVPGDTAGMEVFVPSGLEGDLAFTIPRVSHQYRSFESAERAAGYCEIDVACYSATWGTTAGATARISFISGSFSYLCTGTLLNDTDPSSFIPYFMTAEHCVSTQAEASTINSYWNYQNTTCGGVLGAYTALFGGATLLSHGAGSDHSFLRLNDPAPAGATFSGWTSATVLPGTPMVGIHHPAGDVKKISFGVIDGISGQGGPITGSGGYLRVHWVAGVTEGGSSGSALITGSFPNDRFVGQLWGGSSFCSAPTAPDFYGRFDLVYPLIKAYLSPPVPPSAVTGGASGVNSRAATLTGTANPNGTSTSAFFQYGLTTNYGSSTVAVNVGAGSALVAIGNGAIVGLACNTLYHFRAVATNAVGTAIGSDATFTTSPMCNVTSGDLDNDGKADLGVYRPSTGMWYILQSSTNYSYTTYLAQQWGLSGDVPVPGDYDGDGKADLGVYRPSTGTWYVLLSSTNYSYTTYLAQQWGLSGDVPVPGDYDGDGKADPGVYRPSTGTWYVLLSSTNYSYTTYLAQQWGLSGDVPVAGDYDGDGKVDLGVYRPSTGTWYVLLSSTNYSYTTYLAQQWGLSGDVPVPGDYDGDGKADLGVYRPLTDTWYVLLSSTNYSYTTYLAQQWGLSGDVPVPGDYDGDGKADLGVYRPSTGTWYVLLSSTNYSYTTYLAQQWGLSTDIPIVKRP